MTLPRHVVFGTAGHVDHGKSALVRALTGTDPDRLAEEKEREMTIDLGFDFLSLPGLAEPVAIVDVPGHEMFVRNMVAGATGIDAALFVVAADEGVMPQTVEHLRVLCELQISAGIIALTKSDKVAGDRIAMVSDQVRALVAGTFLEAAAIIPVSSVTGAGMAELRERIGAIASEVQTRPAVGPFRLPVDRSFTIRGAGTVVTGTVVSGRLGMHDGVVVLPAGREVRVRGLQVHGAAVQEIAAGQRAAVNLAGVEKADIARGDVLVSPGSFAPSLMLDVRLGLSADAGLRLEQRQRVRVHHGTAEVMARVVLLEGDELGPGQFMLAQLRLESPLVAAPGDRFVLRSYSPMRVIGGGVVLDAHPPKRRRADGAEKMGAREEGSAKETVLRLLTEAGPAGAAEPDLQVRCGLSADELDSALRELMEGKQATSGRGRRWFGASALDEIAVALVRALSDYHRSRPHWPFAPLNQLLVEAANRPEHREAARLALDSLAASGRIVVAGERVRLSDHQPQWSDRAAALRDTILKALAASGLAAPSITDLARTCRCDERECKDVVEALVDTGTLVALAPGIYLHEEVASESASKVLAFLSEHGEMGVADARALLGASRKYLLPFLERLDREGITQRRDDVRVLGPRRAQAR